MSDESAPGDGWLSFAQAVVAVKNGGTAAFAATPVFGDDDETAEGARIFLVLPDEDEGWVLRFIAGPFFSAAYAANDIIPADEIPERVRELRFLPTRCEIDWLSDQIQVLLGKLTQAAGVATQLPDYAAQPSKSAGPQVVFPVHFLGHDKPH